MAPQRVIFAHLPGHENSGAKRMRCDQLANIARAHLSAARWSFEVMSLPPAGKPGRQRLLVDDVSGAVVIFLKRAWKVLDADNLARWRDVARTFAVDYVDAPATPLPEVSVDLHIASSGALEKHLKTIGRHPIVRIDHHADPRLAPTGRFSAFRAGYFGRAGNVTLPQELTSRIAQHGISDGRIGDDILEHMSGTALHYAVRAVPSAAERDWFKPFTKGFNAAAVGAHVLVNKGVDDAEDWLGADYPFLVESTEPDAIAAVLDQADSIFGTSAWAEAQEPLLQMLQIVQPIRIAAQLERALDSALA